MHVLPLSKNMSTYTHSEWTTANDAYKKHSKTG